jgi:uncharacterized membrane protein YgdD (TMEM256/DUF423 family)
MKNPIIATGASFGALSVALGAFGAHALKAVLSPYALSIFQLSAQYMIIHALIIVALGILYHQKADTRLPKIAIAFSLGIFFFSGSLLLISLTGIAAFGAIAPIGGSLLIFGWLRLAWVFFRGV